MLIGSMLSYFILWLRDYRIRYAAWQKQCNSPNDAAFASTTASRLTMFYSRAKQTFLTPGATYELNLPSSTLAFFDNPVQDNHPDPAAFCEAEKETWRMLEQSLRRFIQSQMTNVGNRRALCGIIAGIVAIILGFIPPIAVNFLEMKSRWLRLTALPGMLLGLTILLSALHGVCLAVYLLGDLRQLRKFELARPPAIAKTKDFNQNFIYTTPPSYPPKTFAHGKQKRPSSLRYATGFSNTTISIYSHEIQYSAMSSGMIEMNPIEGPSTCPILSEYCSNPENDAEWLRQRELYREKERELESAKLLSPASFASTATFIAPFCSPSTTDISGYWDSEEMHSMNAHWYRVRAMADVEKLKYEAARRQPIADFDFDGLPPASAKSAARTEYFDYIYPRDKGKDGDEPQSSLDDEGPHRWEWLLDIISRIQARCSYKKWGANHTDASGPTFLGGVPPCLLSSQAPGGHSSHAASTHSIITFTATESDVSRRIRKRFRIVNAVPAFAVPLTRVLDPVIVRGQWEVVIRSAGFALLISWAICGPLLAIPP